MREIEPLTEPEELHRLWKKRIFPSLLAIGFILIEAYLIFGAKGGFSNTDDPLANALERVVFGSMFLLPIALPIWAGAMYLVCLLGMGIHLRWASRKSDEGGHPGSD